MLRAEVIMKKAKQDESCPTTMSAADFLPKKLSCPALEPAATCQGCPIYCNATQTVFGEGPADAIVMFVGEQPGDQEDKAGKPFVGPAGRDIKRRDGFKRASDASKHGRHQCGEAFQMGAARERDGFIPSPLPAKFAACRPWLVAEIPGDSPTDDRLLGRHRLAIADGQRLPFDAASR